jgi:hypothetical protein
MNAVFKRCAISAMSVTVLLFAGCTSSTTPAASPASDAAKKPEGPAQIVSAKTAFWPMYTAAHQWAPDVEVVRITAKEVPGFKNEGGKAAMWEAVFGSATLRKYRVDTYSIATVLPEIHKGVSSGFQMPWSGPTRDTMPIDTEAFTVDSDAAYKTAVADPGVAEFLKKNPTKTVSTLELGNVFKYHTLVWYVVWGDKTLGYAVGVDASTGKVLKSK